MQSFTEERDPLLVELLQPGSPAPPPVYSRLSSSLSAPDVEVAEAAARAEQEFALKSSPDVLAAVAVPVPTTVDLISDPLFRLSEPDLQCLTAAAFYDKALERDFNLVRVLVFV